MQSFFSSKVFIISLIALLLLIPLSLISSKISERQNYLNEAKNNVATSWTSSQTIMGPIIVQPYIIYTKKEVFNTETNEKTIKTIAKAKRIFILPDQVKMVSNIDNDIRYKGIYKVPVYTANINISGELKIKSVQKMFNRINALGDSIKYEKPYLVTAFSDSRGINSIPILDWSGKKLTFNPGSKISDFSNGIHAYLPSFNQQASEVIEFNFSIELRGMESLSFVPVGQEAIVKSISNWPHPQFIGNFLPVSRTIDETGYQAEWKITSFSSNIAEKVRLCSYQSCEALLAGSFGIKHIEAVDSYLQAERSVKYGFLFIGLTFITFFIFETVKKLPIHAIQYTLVGAAIAIFYLLLVSLSEHLNFALSYSIATFCCVSLLLYYLRFVLGGFKHSVIFSVLLTVLYGVLYVIISAEDFAFLMGGILTFITLVVVMVSSRNINWYEMNDDKNTPT